MYTKRDFAKELLFSVLLLLSFYAMLHATVSLALYIKGY